MLCCCCCCCRLLLISESEEEVSSVLLSLSARSLRGNPRWWTRPNSQMLPQEKAVTTATDLLALEELYHEAWHYQMSTLPDVTSAKVLCCLYLTKAGEGAQCSFHIGNGTQWSRNLHRGPTGSLHSIRLQQIADTRITGSSICCYLQ